MLIMKKYPYSILFIITFLILLPFVWYNVFLEDLIVTASEEPPAPEVPVEQIVLLEGLLQDAVDQAEQPALPLEAIPPDFVTIDKGYWSDALFIGDSRMIGLAEYTDLGDAHVFAKNGLSSFNALTAKNAMPSPQEYLPDMLEHNTYGKVYIMLGLNEMHSSFDKIREKYLGVINTVHDMQPDALIFLCANMHVTASRSETDKTFNNPNIERINQFLQEVAEENGYFYIDVNEEYDTEDGALDPELTYDGIHVRAAHYGRWNDWLRTKGILLPGMEYTPEGTPSLEDSNEE